MPRFVSSIFFVLSVLHCNVKKVTPLVIASDQESEQEHWSQNKLSKCLRSIAAGIVAKAKVLEEMYEELGVPKEKLLFRCVNVLW